MKYWATITALIIVQSLAQAELNTCSTLDREFNFTPSTQTSMKNFIDLFMQNIKNCNLSIQEKGFYYKKLIETLYQSSVPHKLDSILQVSQTITQDTTLEDKTVLDLYRDRQWNTFTNFMNFINKQDDYFLKLEKTENTTRSDRSVSVFEKEIAGYSIRGVGVIERVRSTVLACYKSEEVSYILAPLKEWVDKQIKNKILTNQYFHPYLLHSMGFITSNFLSDTVEKAHTIHFPYHIHTSHVDYAIQNINYTPKTKSLIDGFLKPIRQWTLIRDLYRKQINTYCITPQFNWNKISLEEEYLQPLFPEDMEEKEVALELIYNEIRGEGDYIVLEYDETSNTIYKSTIRTHD